MPLAEDAQRVNVGLCRVGILRARQGAKADIFFAAQFQSFEAGAAIEMIPFPLNLDVHSKLFCYRNSISDQICKPGKQTEF